MNQRWALGGMQQQVWLQEVCFICIFGSEVTFDWGELQCFVAVGPLVEASGVQLDLSLSIHL